jgi:acyl-CoA thioesterase
MPFENHLKLSVAERHADGVTVHFPLSPEFLNSHGVLHGGITATIADEAAWHAIENHFGKPTNCTTTELKVNYLRPILGEKAVARAYLVRAGKTLCVSRIDIMDDSNQLAAIAIVTYMLL